MAQRLRVNSFTTLTNPEPLFRQVSRHREVYISKRGSADPSWK
jgi:hypothetical protein